MKTICANGMIVGRYRDRVITARDRERGCEVDDSHLWTGRVAPTRSHRRRLADQTQFRAPRNI